MALLPNSIEKRILLENLYTFLYEYIMDASNVHKKVAEDYVQFTRIPSNIIQRLYLYNENVKNKMSYPQAKTLLLK